MVADVYGVGHGYGYVRMRRFRDADGAKLRRCARGIITTHLPQLMPMHRAVPANPPSPFFAIATTTSAVVIVQDWTAAADSYRSGTAWFR